jgi:hypothetical protein
LIELSQSSNIGLVYGPKGLSIGSASAFPVAIAIASAPIRTSKRATFQRETSIIFKFKIITSSAYMQEKEWFPDFFYFMLKIAKFFIQNKTIQYSELF